ncbi:MAG: AAA family ATPase, partial [Pseudolabrys sp.]
VVALAAPGLQHRMALPFSAGAEGESVAAVIGRLAARLG